MDLDQAEQDEIARNAAWMFGLDQDFSSFYALAQNEPKLKKAAEAALRNAKPLSQNGYKVQLAQVAVKRAILKAAGGAA